MSKPKLCESSPQPPCWSAREQRGLHQASCTNLALDQEATACRFFHKRADFDLELQTYRHPVLQHTLPPLHLACANADGALQSPSGFVYPPFLALERGVSLQEWLCTNRSPPAILHMFFDIAKQLASVHAASIVHRDLKPDNALWMLHTQVSCCILTYVYDCLCSGVHLSTMRAGFLCDLPASRGYLAACPAPADVAIASAAAAH